MAIVTRYFGVTSAGAGDGTSWADRAALLSSGNWSSVLAGFNFSGSDSMLALVGPGTYSVGETLDDAVFANEPQAAKTLTVEACDSSGVPLSPPNPAWTAAEPAWDTSDMPLFKPTGNFLVLNQSSTLFHMIHIEIDNGVLDTTGAVTNGTLSWCVVTNNYTHTAAKGVNSGCSMSNCVIRMLGTSFQYAVDTATTRRFFHNVRLEGNPSATSGTRRGFQKRGNSELVLSRCVAIGFTESFRHEVTNNAAGHFVLNQCMALNNSSHGVVLLNTAASTEIHTYTKSIFAGNGGYAIDQAMERVQLVGCRFRNNTSGISNLTNIPRLNSIETAGTDADEFVDAANGDYRIKFGSDLWGKGIGAGDEPAPTGGGGGDPIYIPQPRYFGVG